MKTSKRPGEMWLDAAENITQAPDWFIDEHVLPELLRRRKRSSEPRPASKPSPEQEARQGWDESEGEKEFLYVAVNGASWSGGAYFGLGSIRIPRTGRWMYVRCPVLGADRKPSGELMYWRHQRWLPSFEFEQSRWAEKTGRGPRRNNTYSCGGKGTIWRTKKDYMAREEMTHRPTGPIYTVEQCKRELQRHHPDKGGDPAQAALWTERLNTARRTA